MKNVSSLVVFQLCVFSSLYCVDPVSAVWIFKDAVIKSVADNVPSSVTALTSSASSSLSSNIPQIYINLSYEQESISKDTMLAAIIKSTNRTGLRASRSSSLEEVQGLLCVSKNALQNIHLTQAQRHYFSHFTEQDWVVYLNHLQIKEWDEIRDLHSLYEFESFQQLVQDCSGFQPHLESMYRLLNPLTTTYNQQSFDKIVDSPYGVAIHKMLLKNEHIKKLIAHESYQKIAQEFGKSSAVDLMQKVRDLKLHIENLGTNICKHSTPLQVESKKLQGELTKLVLNSQIEAAERLLAKAQDNEILSYEHLGVSDLLLKQDAINVEIVEAQRCFDLCNQTLNTLHTNLALAGSDQIKKNTINKAIDYATINVAQWQRTQNLLQNNLNTIVQKIENKQVHLLERALEAEKIYADRGTYLTHQEADALAQTIGDKGVFTKAQAQLTPQALNLIKSSEYNLQNFLEFTGNKVQIQSFNDMISLVNRATEHQISFGSVKNFDVLVNNTLKLANTGIVAAKKGDMCTAWSLTRLGNAALDCGVQFAQGCVQELQELGHLGKQVIDLTGDILDHPLTALNNLVSTITELCTTAFSDKYTGDFAGLKTLLSNDPTRYAELQQLGQTLKNQHPALNLKDIEAGLAYGIEVENKCDYIIEQAQNLDAPKVARLGGRLTTNLLVADALFAKASGLIKAGYINSLGTIQKAENLLGAAVKSAPLLKKSELAYGKLETFFKETASTLKTDMASLSHLPLNKNNIALANMINQEIPVVINSAFDLAVPEMQALKTASADVAQSIKQVQTQLARPELQAKVEEYLKQYQAKMARPRCDIHNAITYSGKHIHVPEELAGIVSNAQDWEKLVKAFDGTMMTPVTCGQQASIWTDYQHIFGPVIKVDCKKGTTTISGFHHDYLGKIRESGIIKFGDVKQLSHDFYEADWFYNNTSKGSTFFPENWTPSKVMTKVQEALANPIGQPILNKNAWEIIGATKEGIEINVILAVNNNVPTGKIITAFPIFKV